MEELLKLNIVKHGRIMNLKFVDELTTQVSMVIEGQEHTFLFRQKEGLVPIVGQTFRLHLEAL